MAGTATATTYSYRRGFQQLVAAPSSRSCSVKYVKFARSARRFYIRSSPGDATVETTSTATTTETGEEKSDQVEVQQGPPSLISALNVEKALRGILISDIDYYGTLGLQKGCSNDEVTVAYKNKLQEVTDQGLDEGELSKRVELLKESHSILSSVEDRRLYDWSLARNGNPDTYVWPFEVDTVRTSTESPQQDEEDVGPTRLVGYFMLGWIVLSIILSIALNR